MPNDGGACDWEADLAGRIGRAVAARRKQLLLTAASLSARTKKLGYPIAAAAIVKTENGERTIDVAELLVVAAALEIPPVLLLFPGFPDSAEQVLPGVTGASESAVRWLSGTDGLPGPVDDESDRGLYATSGVNAGIALVELVNEMRQRHLDDFSLQLDGEHDSARAEIQRRLDALPDEIADARTELWGG